MNDRTHRINHQAAALHNAAATGTIADNLTATLTAAEWELGRIAADADVDALAAALIGAAHLLFADRNAPPAAGAVHKTVTTVLASVVQEPQR